MSLLGGDLTTPARVATWLPNPPATPSAILSQLIGSMTGLIYGELNRARLYSQTFTRVFDGVGTQQIVLPDWPVTSITSVQQGSQLILPYPLPVPNTPPPAGQYGYGYGYRFVPWSGNLPGDPSVIELVGGYFYPKVQNVKVTYQAGYLVQSEPQSVPASAPYTATVLQQQGIWCRDNGVVYASTGVALTPVTTLTAAGQYIIPPDSSPGLYTFDAADAGAALLISYSFIPSPLEEACIQMVAERYNYRTRVGDLSKSLGGQETVRFMRSGLPPEVVELIKHYVSVVPPAIGAPV